MVTSKNELKILEWDVCKTNKQTNKQTNKHSFVCCFTSFLCETSRMDNRAYHHLWYVMAIYYKNWISNMCIPTEKMTWLSKIFGNKRPHRSYCSPQKPLQIKKHIWYNQYIDLKKTDLKIEWSLFVKSWITFTQWCFVSKFVKIGPVILDEKIFKLCQCIFAIALCKTVWSFLWTNLKPNHSRVLCARFGGY